MLKLRNPAAAKGNSNQQSWDDPGQTPVPRFLFYADTTGNYDPNLLSDLNIHLKQLLLGGAWGNHTVTAGAVNLNNDWARWGLVATNNPIINIM